MSKKILVADDSQTIRHIVELCFQTTEFSVDPAATADELKQKLAGDAALVLLDSKLPGPGATELIQACAGTAPVVVLGCRGDGWDESKARAAGAAGWIAKPFESQAICSLVTEVAARAPAPMAAGSFADALSQQAPGSPAAATPGLTPPPPPTPELSGEDIIIEDFAAEPSVPGLEPPPAPETRAKTDDVDVWAFADTSGAAATSAPPAPGPSMGGGAASAPSEPARTAAPTPSAGASVPPAASMPTIEQAASVVAGRAAAELGVSGDNAQVAHVAREVVERIAWEVVPDLAEAIIREELARLLGTGPRA